MKKTVYIIAIVWSLITLGIVFYNESIFSHGETVLLKVRPFDPRDFLRGDYVSLQYDINRLTFSAENSPKVNYHKTAYVILEKDKDGHASAKGITYSKPEDKLFIKAQINSYMRDRKKKQATYYVDYKDIGRYYMKESTGLKLENKLRKNGGYAQVYIAPNGNARIKKIITE